jgi:hypothetical protein
MKGKLRKLIGAEDVGKEAGMMVQNPFMRFVWRHVVIHRRQVHFWVSARHECGAGYVIAA